MKKAKKSSEGSDIRPEYNRKDFGKMARGMFHKQVLESSNVVILDSTVAKEFPNSVAVNRALKGIISKRKTGKLSKKAVVRTKRATKFHQASKRH